MNRRIDALDGLRGIAVVLVCGYHFGTAMPGGWLGVDIFFVLSGFVVMRSVVARRRSGSWSTRGFLAGRFVRLAPAALLAVLFVSVLSFTDAETAFPLGEVLGAASMLYNGFLVAGFSDGHYLQHFWSLSLEWQFYMTIPLLVVGMERTGETRMIGTLLVAAALVEALRIWTLVSFDVSRGVYVLTPFHADGLMLGCALALVRPRHVERVAALPFAATLAIATLVACGLFVPHWGGAPLFGFTVMIPVVEAATLVFIAVAVHGSSPMVEKHVARGLLLWIGQRSYSLYIWHYLLGIVWLTDGKEGWQGPAVFVVQVLVSVLAAELSYRFVEQPSLRSRRRAAAATAAL